MGRYLVRGKGNFSQSWRGRGAPPTEASEELSLASSVPHRRTPHRRLVIECYILVAKQFSQREILTANSESRATSQAGARRENGASKSLTRRPATHNRASDSRARPRLVGLSADNLRPGRLPSLVAAIDTD